MGILRSAAGGQIPIAKESGATHIDQRRRYFHALGHGEAQSFITRNQSSERLLSDDLRAQYRDESRRNLSTTHHVPGRRYDKGLGR